MRPPIAGVPVVGDLDGVASLALAGHVDAVAVGPAPGWTAVRLQQLAWDLDCSRTALLVDRRLVQLVRSADAGDRRCPACPCCAWTTPR